VRIKRAADIVLSFALLLAASPILIISLLLVWAGDFNSPVYFAERIGKDGQKFRMFKVRTMVPDADKSSIISTGAADSRITPVGRLIRSFKLDEVLQLTNVLRGDMSLVGPRPNTWRNGVELYNETEKRLLNLRPGITDLASIVFADEAQILENVEDPDLAYNQLIRPWKSRLGLVYIDNGSFWLDLRLVFWTVLNTISRRAALKQICGCLVKLGVSAELARICGRDQALTPAPPPGSDQIVTSLS
jgi:lipopolysaccharide/colanic/teichoic acid biosynthesis glycosyltransferase